jgi:REP element-mobilizing transposase RayT
LEIGNRYDIRFLKIGTDKNLAHFLTQSVPKFSVADLAKRTKKQLRGGESWDDDYFASTVGKHSSKEVISKYAQK